MKRILLSSAAVISFAGVAAADGHLGVTFSGSAELGFNDTAYSTTLTTDADDADALNTAFGVDTADSGFYTDLEVTIGLAAELDNGLTAAASIDLEDLADGADATEYELSLTSADSGLYYGDTNFAAQNVWVSAGDMAADNFSEADGEEVLRAEIGFGNVAAQMSYANGGGVAGADTLEQLSLGVSADFGNVNVVAAYQDAASAAFTASRGAMDADGDGVMGEAANGDFNGAEVFGLSVGTSFAGADVRLAYADNGTEDSTGISVSYPVGPVTVDASYAVNSVSDDNWDLSVAYENGPIAVTVSTDEGDDWGIEGSYDVGNGLMVYAGVVDAGEDFYIGGEYDLGSGAALLVSFADDGDNDEAAGDDDIGAQDYMVGTTVELSFEF